MNVTKLLIRLMTLLTFATVCSTQHSGTQLRRESRVSKYPPHIYQMYRDQILKKPSKPMGYWSEWSPWSPCSRSCGGGITHQTRHCVNRPADSRFAKRQRRRRQSGRPMGGCVGLYKRVRLCNDKECPSRTDFRFEQCAAFNKKTFRGAIHQWEPYLKVKDECALNCRAVGMDFFATLNKTVIDGTSCLYPMTHTGKAAPRGTRGACVGGYCKAVNSHGVVGSIDTEIHPPDEQCAACRRSTCRDINGIYTKPDLPPGYSLVAQIPAGACKVLIEQLKHTRNLLALKHTNGSFIVNGDWKFSNSRVVSGAGTKFVYVRQDENSLENIKSPGPLTSSVDIMIVNYQANTGIKYSYSLPMEDTPVIAPPLIKRPTPVDPSIIETRRLETPYNNVTLKDESRPQILHPGPRRTRIRRKHFHWKITGLTACSKSCGGGIQTYVKTCIRELGTHNQMPVHDRRCAHLDSPTSTPIRCNTDPCPPSWEHQWTDCSVTCGEGIQQNIPRCKQDLSNGPVPVSESLCQTIPKPAVQSRPCRKPACESISDNELPKVDDSRSWLTGNWSQCSVTCGTGHRTRSVICSPGKHCKMEHRPSHAEYCNMGPCSASFATVSDSDSRNSISSSSWMVTEWSHCSEACGTGYQTRLALCDNEEETVCSETSKPEVSRACSSEKECGGQWFTGSWGRCSDSCSGRAKQKREVICIVKIRGQSHITNEMTCSAHLKPPEEQSCESSCPPHWFVGEWGQCEDSCPVGVQRREVKCLDSHGRKHNDCAVDDMPVSKRTCACPVKSASDSREKYKPAQDEPADRSCVDKIRKCKLAVQARLCHYPYYTTHCCESCRRAQDMFE